MGIDFKKPFTGSPAGIPGSEGATRFQGKERPTKRAQSLLQRPWEIDFKNRLQDPWWIFQIQEVRQGPKEKDKCGGA